MVTTACEYCQQPITTKDWPEHWKEHSNASQTKLKGFIGNCPYCDQRVAVEDYPAHMKAAHSTPRCLYCNIPVTKESWQAHCDEKHNTPETRVFSVYYRRWLKRCVLHPSHPMFIEDHDSWDFINGLNCGIPLCCVLEWCSFEKPLKEELSNFVHRKESRHIFMHDDDDGSYHMCIECALKAGKVILSPD